MTAMLSRGESEPSLAWFLGAEGLDSPLAYEALREVMGGCDLLLSACSRTWEKPQRLPQSSVNDGIKVPSPTERSWISVRRSQGQDLLASAPWLSCSSHVSWVWPGKAWEGFLRSFHVVSQAALVF